LLLDGQYGRRHKDISIVRYILGNPPKITVDQDTTAFKDDADLQSHIKSATDWWREKFPGERENYFNDLYSSHKNAHDDESGRVVLKASKCFQYGASGSPIVYLFNDDGQPVVEMIYQRGFPEFYYDALEGNRKYEHFNVEINMKICLFEGGTTMMKLANLLEKHGYINLKANIFSEPKSLYSRATIEGITFIYLHVCNYYIDSI